MSPASSISLDDGILASTPEPDGTANHPSGGRKRTKRKPRQEAASPTPEAESLSPTPEAESLSPTPEPDSAPPVAESLSPTPEPETVSPSDDHGNEECRVRPGDIVWWWSRGRTSATPIPAIVSTCSAQKVIDLTAFSTGGPIIVHGSRHRDDPDLRPAQLQRSGCWAERD